MNSEYVKYLVLRFSYLYSVYLASLADILRVRELLGLESKSFMLSDSILALECISQSQSKNPIAEEIQNRMHEAVKTGQEMHLIWTIFTWDPV